MVMLFIVILTAWQALLEVGVAHIIVGGPGGTLPEAVYKDAATLYTFVRPEVVVRYNAVGSGAAKAAYAAGTGTFACSDSPIAASMYASTPDLQMVCARSHDRLIVCRLNAVVCSVPDDCHCCGADL